jgi:hypothetical protein
MEKKLNYELHRSLSLPLPPDNILTELWIDGGGFGNGTRLSFNLVDNQGNRIGGGMTASSFQLTEDQIIHRLVNPSNVEAILEIKKLSIMYRNAEKYANADNKQHNPTIDLLNNFKSMILIFSDKVEKIIQDKNSLSKTTKIVDPPETFSQNDETTFYQRNNKTIVLLIGFFIGFVILFWEIFPHKNIARCSSFVMFYFLVIFFVFTIWSLTIDDTIFTSP